MNYKNVSTTGFALLLTLIISSVLLAVGLTLLNVTLKQFQLSAVSRESEIAFQVAQIGMECARYWRYEKGPEFTANSETNPSLNCLGITFNDSFTSGHTPLSGSGAHNRFNYQSTVNLGTNRCMQIAVDVIVSGPSARTVSITNFGSKSCGINEVCTVVISRGYNVACSQIGTNIYTVQRELTAEF